jgi:N-acetylated-alpha-linked acidic dipeptidase
MERKTLRSAAMAFLKRGTWWAATAVAFIRACARERDLTNVEEPLVRRQDTVTFPPIWDKNEAILASSLNNTSIVTWSYYHTHGLHIAGTNRTMAQWTADRWNENGFTANVVEYCMSTLPSLSRDPSLTCTDVFLNYPVSHSLSRSLPNGTTFAPSLIEEVLPEDDTTSYPNRLPTFHGYSFAGAAPRKTSTSAAASKSTSRD